jgi:molybdate transport system substrate-binding protein
MHGPLRAGVLALLAAALLTGCGGAGGDRNKVVRLAAAASLAPAFDGCTAHIPETGVAQEFGGSDQLAAQIRRGINIDMFASANMELPEAIAREGRGRRPVPFATNELVLAVPRRSLIRSLSDLRRAGRLRIAIGSAGVPVGIYARQVVDRLAPALRTRIEQAITARPPDVAHIIAELTGRHVDAGFLYRTDVRSTHGGLRAIPIPAALRPKIVYGVSILHDSDEARRIVADLLHGGCAKTRRAVGFGPPRG